MDSKKYKIASEIIKLVQFASILSTETELLSTYYEILQTTTESFTK
jgi:hypothetical protein